MNNEVQGGLDCLTTPHQQPYQSEKEKMLSLLDTFIEAYGNEKIKFVCSPECLDNVVGRIKRSRKEFDSNCFFVLIVGPLKSGKSTFVNILSRAKVSPTDVLECTAIPTIIGKADSGHLNKIAQYFLYDSSQISDEQESDLKIKIFDTIVDVLRGIEDKRVLNGLVSMKTSDATEENINKAVMLSEYNAQSKSLIATIGIEGGDFIDNEIMIIDMPGLDGKGKNDKDPLYHKMVERADFIFFVQSSTAAINEATSEFLDWLLKNKLTEVPFWLIHNLHQSLYFLKDETTDEMVQKQVEAGKKYIKDRFNVKNEFDNFILNFAKIKNGLMSNECIQEDFADDIRDAVDQYKSLEKEIVKKLKEDRQRIKDQNCVNKAKGNIDVSVNGLNDLFAKVTDEIENSGRKMILARSFSNKVLQHNLSYAELMESINALFISDSIENALEMSIVNKTRDELGSGGEVKGRELKLKIENLATSYSRPSSIGEGSYFRQSLIQEVQKIFSKEYASLICEIRDFIKHHTGRDVYIVDSINPTVIPWVLSDFSPNYYGIREYRNLVGITNRLSQKIYTYQEHSDYLNKFRELCKDDIPAKIVSYKNAIKTSFADVKTNFINSINGQFDESLNEIIRDLEQERSLLIMQQQLITEMINKLEYNEN